MMYTGSSHTTPAFARVPNKGVKSKWLRNLCLLRVRNKGPESEVATQIVPSWGGGAEKMSATQCNMRREERVTVQGPVKIQKPDGMSHRG